ncbi:MAG: DNA-formamidopyrimidine glycosylase family protein [Planctomycetota bacterium]|jgi:formamidopyrimidine-DNA glycosylase
MFEIPEFVTLAKQMNQTLKGKKVQRGQLGNSPHKFVWYNRSHDEFEKLTKAKTIGEARTRGKWLFIPLEPGYVLLLGECGGKVSYHPAGSKVPKKYHLYITFDDDSFLTATTQMWGAMELYEKGQEKNREYVKAMRTTPIEPEFSFDYFRTLAGEMAEDKRLSAKGLLTQNQIIPGLGNAIAQDILFRACLHPRHPIVDLSTARKRSLYNAIIDTVGEAIDKGGRYDEYDLYNNRGGYIRIMDKNALKRPCPKCGGKVEKIQYLGGACYLCSNCQK